MSDAALEKGFENMAASYQRPVAEIKAYYDANQDKLAYFKHTLLEKEALNLIIEHSRLEEVQAEIESGAAQAAEATAD